MRVAAFNDPRPYALRPRTGIIGGGSGGGAGGGGGAGSAGGASGASAGSAGGAGSAAGSVGAGSTTTGGIGSAGTAGGGLGSGAATSGGLSSGSSTALPEPLGCAVLSLPGSGLTTNPSAPTSVGPGVERGTNPSAFCPLEVQPRAGRTRAGSPGL